MAAKKERKQFLPANGAAADDQCRHDNDCGPARRFYVAPDVLAGELITLTGDEAHHLRNVLRLNPGSLVTLFDGEGRQCQATVKEMSRRQVVLATVRAEAAKDRGARLHLVQAVLKGKKMDVVIEKAVELGVDRITPLVSHFTNAPADNDRERRARWHRIAVAACKQCGRNRLPEIDETIGLTHLLQEKNDENVLRLVLYEGEKETGLRQLFSSPATFRGGLVLIGPEGGFHPAEIIQARDHGFQSVTLGQATLRAETAAIVAIGIVQLLLGNLGD